MIAETNGWWHWIIAWWNSLCVIKSRYKNLIGIHVRKHLTTTLNQFQMQNSSVCLYVVFMSRDYNIQNFEQLRHVQLLPSSSSWFWFFLFYLCVDLNKIFIAIIGYVKRPAVFSSSVELGIVNFWTVVKLNAYLLWVCVVLSWFVWVSNIIEENTKNHWIWPRKNMINILKNKMHQFLLIN